MLGLAHRLGGKCEDKMQGVTHPSNGSNRIAMGVNQSFIFQAIRIESGT
jgi:hypothetical protein